MPVYIPKGGDALASPPLPPQTLAAAGGVPRESTPETPIFIPPQAQEDPPSAQPHGGRVGGRVAATFLADYAELRDGLLTIVGGLLTSVSYRERVGTLGRDLVLFVESEGAGVYELGIRVVGPDGDVLTEGLVGEFSCTTPGVRPHVVALRNLQLTSPGVHTIAAEVSGTWVASLDFQVVVAP